MPGPSGHLATSFGLLRELQRTGGVAIRARDLSLVHREGLTRNGFLREVMKGWYIPSRPEEPAGDNTAWYAAYWAFAAEPEPAVRVVLGHFFFEYVHPYFDGNGRMGRFLMNLMVASGGWRWTLVTVDTRDEYMAALEQASVHQDIAPLTRYLAARCARE